MAPCERGTGVRPPSRVPPSSFEGEVFRPYGSGWHSAAELPRPYRTTPHSGGDGLTGGVGGTTSGHDSQSCQGRGVDSSLTWVPANVSALNAPVGGAGAEATSPRGPRARRNLARGGVQPPSEAEPHPRGATGPRARWKFACVVSCPSSEAEFYSRVAGPSAWWAAGSSKAVGLAVGP
jgi:hypothetical protein